MQATALKHIHVHQHHDVPGVNMNQDKPEAEETCRLPFAMQWTGGMTNVQACPFYLSPSSVDPSPFHPSPVDPSSVDPS